MTLRFADEVTVAQRAGTQAKVHVLEPVAEPLVEAAEFQEDFLADDDAGPRHRRPGKIGLVGGERVVFSGVQRVALVRVKKNAEVVDQTADRLALHVAHHRHAAVPTRQPGHRLQPARQQHGVIVEQAEQGSLRAPGSRVVVRREPARRVVEPHTVAFLGQRAEEFAGAVRAAVIDEEHLVFPVDQRALQALQVDACQVEPVVERGDDRNIHRHR